MIKIPGLDSVKSMMTDLKKGVSASDMTKVDKIKSILNPDVTDDIELLRQAVPDAIEEGFSRDLNEILEMIQVIIDANVEQNKLLEQVREKFKKIEANTLDQIKQGIDLLLQSTGEGKK